MHHIKVKDPLSVMLPIGHTVLAVSMCIKMTNATMGSNVKTMLKEHTDMSQQVTISWVSWVSCTVYFFEYVQKT